MFCWSATPPPIVMDESSPHPCNIEKKGKCHKRRRHGGVATGLLPCGIIANMLPVAGHESATQIIAMVAEMLARKFLKYVTCDNGCMLAHFARNRAGPSSSTTLQQIAESTFVIDKFHMKNHKGMLRPQSQLLQRPRSTSINTLS